MEMILQLTIFWVIFQECSGLPKRSKRIINGDVWKGRPSTYNAIRYYGAITSSHATWYTFGNVFDFVKDSGLYGEMSCAGSILTPDIFQTACHCVASFDVSHPGLLKPPIITHQWEGKLVVYFGVSNRFGEDSMETSNYVLTEKFLVHEKCAGLGGNSIATYDYTLIQTSSDFLHYQTWKYKWLEIRYAPQYTNEDISDFHYYALKKQLACLMVGFGVFDNSEDRKFYSSDVLRHGWSVLLPDYQCVQYTEFIMHDRDPVVLDSEHVNWVCTKQFAFHDQYLGAGDSGSPLSCDNRYFGVASGIRFTLRKDGKRYNFLSIFHPLLHNLFPNSVNYRTKLLYVVFRLQEKYEITGKLYLPPGGRGNSEKIMSVMSQDPKFQLTSGGVKLQPHKLALPFLIVAFTILNRMN